MQVKRRLAYYRITTRIAFGKTEAVPETLESKEPANPIP